MFVTLDEARNVCAKHVNGGSSPSSPVVDDRINEAEMRLIPKGDFKNTNRRMRIYSQNSTITLPRGVEKAKFLNVDKNPRRIFTPFHEFLDGGPGEIDTFGEGYQDDMIDCGYVCSFFDPPTDSARKIFAVSTALEDVGSLFTIRGYKELRMEVRTDSTPGEAIPICRWSGGIEGQLDDANFPTLSTNNFWELINVYKPRTVGYVSLYSYDETTRQMWFLGKYHPEETVPSYRRYRMMAITSPPTALDRTGNYYHSILMMVKLGHVPVSHEQDILVIQNLGAIKNMVIAIEHENAYEDEDALKAEATAVRLLREQMSDAQTQDKSAFNVDCGDWRIGTNPNIG